MKILVTGGAGFIGSHVAGRLLERGDEVTILDNFNDYYDPKLKHDRVSNLRKDFKSLRDVTADISSLEQMERLFRVAEFDKIVHLAAQAGVRYSIENPHAYAQSNLIGTLNLLEMCKKHEIKDFVFAS